jgi:hypothetical protein
MVELLQERGKRLAILVNREGEGQQPLDVVVHSLPLSLRRLSRIVCQDSNIRMIVQIATSTDVTAAINAALAISHAAILAKKAPTARLSPMCFAPSDSWERLTGRNALRRSLRWGIEVAVRYGRLPYVIRYLVALMAWAAIVLADLFVRIAFLVFLPFLWVATAFGQAHTQGTAQMGASYVDFYIRPFMRRPRLRLRQARRSSAYEALK